MGATTVDVARERAGHAGLAAAREPASSLFDSESVWRHEPGAAFDALLQSGRFGATRREAAAAHAGVDRHDMPLSAVSSKVYAAMFDRYLRHLRRRHQACAVAHEPPSLLFAASPRDVEAFVCAELGDVSRETLWRYIRLVERVHEHLVRMGWASTNPATQWLQSMATGGLGLRSLMSSRKPPAEPVVSPDVVLRLLQWMRERMQELGQHGAAPSSWKRARDLTAAAVALGAGLRFTELAKMRRDQVSRKCADHGVKDPSAQEVDIEIEVPGWASVPTSRPHRVFLQGACAQIMNLWMTMRFESAGPASRARADLVFPATLSGRPMSATIVYRNLQALADEAIDADALDECDRWILCSGASGLRRAYVLSELGQGRDPELLTERLGHWRRKSVRKYEPLLRASRS